MKMTVYTSFVYLLLIYAIKTEASTHWMVTESGLIQPRLDSPFELARPYDLLAFLNQDKSWESITSTYHDIMHTQTLIDNLWVELEQTIELGTKLVLDKNCVKAGRLTYLDWYLPFIEDGKSSNIPDVEYLLHKPFQGIPKDVPDCKKICSLTFSMSTFEHLESVNERDNLVIEPELKVVEQLTSVMTVEQFGHWVANILRQNTSSWLHYNMASMYWRNKGNAPKALECCRRAVHFAPRIYKDIALFNFGALLHRCKMTDDAVIVLQAAADHSPTYPLHYFMLGNAYTVLGDFDTAISHFDNCLKMYPNFKEAQKHKHGVLCHAYLLPHMETVQGIVNNLREKLSEFFELESEWLNSLFIFLKILKDSEKMDYKDNLIDKIYIKMEQLSGFKAKELRNKSKRFAIIRYLLNEKFTHDWFSEKYVNVVEAAYTLQEFVKDIEDKSSRPTYKPPIDENHKISNSKSEGLESKPSGSREKSSSSKKGGRGTGGRRGDKHSHLEGGIVLYPATMQVSRGTEDFDTDPEWPSASLCKDAASSFPQNLEAVYPVFMPFENKGFRLRGLLTTLIGVPVDVEHQLPWHPPLCAQEKGSPTYTKKNIKGQMGAEVSKTGHLREKLLAYVGDGSAEKATHMQDAEIGHRIYVAMQMDVAPKWLLFTMSSLYWRVRDNIVNALNCGVAAKRSVPVQHKDLVLTTVASLYLETGHFDEALANAEEAFWSNPYEPATNFLLSQLNMLKQHRSTQLFHVKQTIRVQPQFMSGIPRILLLAWSCARPPSAGDVPATSEDDICRQLEATMSAVCDRDADSCRLSNVHCYTTRALEGSTLVRMLQLKGEDIQSSYIDEIRADLFDETVDKVSATKDVSQHRRNFELMKQALDNALKRCSQGGCSGGYIVELPVNSDNCKRQHLQLAYWLHVATFQQLTMDTNLKLPLEITSALPTGNKLPECQVPLDDSEDYFLQRLNDLDIGGWKPLTNLQQQLTEIFGYHDFDMLGAKLAQFVETQPSSWVGVVSAGWWCGAAGRGRCARDCLAAAAVRQVGDRPGPALRALVALFSMQSKYLEAKDVAYLSFYSSPKSTTEAFLVALAHTYLGEYDKATWMYRYALTLNENYLPAKACLHTTMCLIALPEDKYENHN